MLGVGWGLSEKRFWRRAYICQECMICIIGQENVLLKQARGDRTLKMHHFWKKYKKVFFQPPVNLHSTPSQPPKICSTPSQPSLNPQRTPTQPSPKILFHNFSKNAAFSRFCHPQLVLTKHFPVQWCISYIPDIYVLFSKNVFHSTPSQPPLNPHPTPKKLLNPQPTPTQPPANPQHILSKKWHFVLTFSVKIEKMS